jgi:NAD(P)-dependent dehydrogenase (short-subunit alcohol dehydrogenase family)
LDDRVGAGLDACIAQQAVIEIPAGGSREIAFLFGEAPSRETALSIVKRYRNPDAIPRALADVTTFWRRGMDRVRVRTPLPALDVLVNGVASDEPGGTIVDLSPAIWDQTFAANVRSAFLMSRAVIPVMARSGGGSIIHIASQLGRVGTAKRPAYCATKGALIQLARSLAIDHAAQGIRANTLSPGAIETRRMLQRHRDMDEARRTLGPKHVLGRLGKPAEIARAAVYLASDASSFMTGSDLLVDGGYTAI